MALSERGQILSRFLEVVQKLHKDESGMFVIERRSEEGFWIGDKIFVKILEIQRGRVQIGIDAPAEIPIDREEIHERNRKSPATQPSDN